METSDLLTDAFARIRDLCHDIVDGLSPETLAYRVDAEANSIAWLVWHLTRVEDDHLSGAAETEQLWTTEGWQERFGLPFAAGDIGYGHSSEEVGAVTVASGALLLEYCDAVGAEAERYVRGLTSIDLDMVVDRSFDPPVTLGVRLVSVVSDCFQHAGQAAFVRGLAERRPA